MKKKIIYVDFNKKRRINFLQFAFNKIISSLVNRKPITNNKISNINTDNNILINKIY